MYVTLGKKDKKSFLYKEFIDEQINLLSDLLKESSKDCDQQYKFPEQLINEMQECGLFNILIPTEYGGKGGTITDTVYAIEKVAQYCSSTAIIMMFHYQVVKRIMEFGDEFQREKYLKKLAGSSLGASAWTEPNSGANKHGLSAVLRNNDTTGYVLEGRKSFCTGAGKAAIYTVLVKTDFENNESFRSESFGLSNQSFVIIESGDLGVEFGDKWSGMGMRGTETGELSFSNCKIPRNRLLGGIGEGVNIMRANRSSALHPGIVALGISKKALEISLNYAKERELVKFQAVRFYLAEMKIKLSAMELMVYQSAKFSDENLNDLSAYYTMQSKVLTAESAINITNSALQVLGSKGYINEFLIEKLYRDVRAISLMGPTTELCKEMVFTDLDKWGNEL
ncbi:MULTISPECIES: acyl-CoA dehydrogenase family protein [Bacillus cereus group]|uniref:acyl-CoA dehydrogenase family protein n=1 Tax=Bacillus cereus group TaxID=86661 RepID=UPI00103E79F4|nr:MULTISPECIES: acyl-CoA dehydrogenase family protein [Bacillus cereus group]HDR4766537.1 acyl-CoA/acyl-ACP dehydrogenase [Bacillus cereus]QEL82570.1 acyl-CoA dehydrogenase [Bacillus sp. JAS24-2]TBX44244.1 acyl-CoA dehydrogenase [Bacillus thuringiensis]HDR4799445.1 acyl-CoA/acyl-ACP dehydrogenase [Bacillus cereus]HDR4805489.1 acyl-CoA/acyl-ACP dehydrogenase [Bacillus cereus]